VWDWHAARLPGDGLIVLHGGVLGSNQTCAITVSVTASAHGRWTNAAVALWTDQTGRGRSNQPAALSVSGVPLATTLAASDKTTNSVRLNAAVNSSGFATQVYFEYGASTNLGSTTATQSLAGLFAEATVTANLSGLLPRSTHYYRVVAANAQGTVRGAMFSVTTIGLVELTSCQPEELIAAVTGGAVVTVACDGTIVLTNEIAVSDDTTIDATGRRFTLSGNQSTRIFSVTNNARLRLVNLTLRDGRAQYGGAINNGNGRVELLNCTLEGNVAVAGTNGVARGGAIWNSGSLTSRLTIANCTFSGNGAEGGPIGDGNWAAGAFGGAIANGDEVPRPEGFGGVIAVNSTFFGNSVSSSYNTPTPGCCDRQPRRSDLRNELHLRGEPRL
jgi:hypothetical protein